MAELTDDDIFVCNDEEEIEIDDELRAALDAADEDIKAGRVFPLEEARERVASWRTRFTSRTSR